jgi:hypothetical protein
MGVFPIALVVSCAGGASSAPSVGAPVGSIVSSISGASFCDQHRPAVANDLKVALETGAGPARLYMEDIRSRSADPGAWTRIPADRLVERCIYTVSGSLPIPGTSGGLSECGLDYYVAADGLSVPNKPEPSGASCGVSS